MFRVAYGLTTWILKKTRQGYIVLHLHGNTGFPCAGTFKFIL